MPLDRQTIAIILNPISGRGRGARRRPHLERLLTDAASANPNGIEWEIVETHGPGDAVKLARAAAEAGATVVAAAGGDGTVNEVLNGIMGTGVRMAVLPLGTGNDIVRTLDFGNDLEKAVAALCAGHTRAVDVGRVHGRWFLNIAGCGFDAVVGERVNRGFHFLTGTAAYVAALVQTLLTFRPVKLTLRVDGETRRIEAMMCSVCNARTYGGGMRIAPDAELDDGLFDICILGAAGKIEFLAAFPRVYKGTHITHPRVTILRGAAVRVESDPRLPVFVDGDVIGTTPAEFTLSPRALEIVVPAVGRPGRG